MNPIYRLLLIQFDFLTAKVLFPIIINWERNLQALYEVEIMNKIIAELEQSLGVKNVRVVQNKLGVFPLLQEEFNEIIGDINYQTPTSQIRGLPVDHKIFRPLTEEDVRNGVVERFLLNEMYLPVRVIDHTKITLEEMNCLPVLIIEQ